jgi:hypothetical protein
MVVHPLHQLDFQYCQKLRLLVPEHLISKSFLVSKHSRK